jgi:hypothetical protein
MKSLIDRFVFRVQFVRFFVPFFTKYRCGSIAYQQNFFLKHKIGAAVVAVRRGGGTAVFDQVFFFISAFAIHHIAPCPFRFGSPILFVSNTLFSFFCSL